MDHHLDHKIVLNEESEYKSLYSWCIQEIDSEGKSINGNYIPWEWTLPFLATNLEFVSTTEVDRYAKSSNHEIIKEKSFIRCNLKPEARPHLAHRETSYYMLGTDRVVSDFTLMIYQAESGDEESFRSWGSVSYTSEIDFRDITQPDQITFYMTVSLERFAEYVRRIKERSIDKAGLRIGRVKGFYSEWSPAISADRIKILTEYKEDHPIEIAEGLEIDPPRLGNVGEFSFYLSSISELDSNASMDISEDFSKDDNLFNQNNFQSNIRTETSSIKTISNSAIKTLSSIRIAVWIIAVLLLLILFK